MAMAVDIERSMAAYCLGWYVPSQVPQQHVRRQRGSTAEPTLRIDRRPNGIRGSRTPPRRPVVDPVVGSFLGVCEPAPAPWCFESQFVLHEPLDARPSGDSFAQ